MEITQTLGFGIFQHLIHANLTATDKVFSFKIQNIREELNTKYSS